MGKDPQLVEALPLDRLHPHPDNPRLLMREDVIDDIAAQIKRNRFGIEHAIRVRPHDGDWQIVAGHHRVEAAKKAGLTTVPGWVKDMTDHEALMALVLDNTHGELALVERAWHVYRATGRGRRGRGNVGDGLKAYAEEAHRSRQSIGTDYSVGELVEKCQTSGTFPAALRDKYSAIVEVAKAPETTQQPLLSALATSNWSVADTARKVQETRKFDVPDGHQSWLPVEGLVDAYLANGRPTPSATAKLISSADGVLDHISRDGTAADAALFRQWLVDNSGEASWDHRAISRYHADLIIEWSERDADLDGGRSRIYHCRAAELLQHVDPGSVDLVFTDPPYPVEFVECWTELGELAAKVLRPGGLLVAYTGQYTMLDAADRLRAAGLSYYWCHAIQHDGAFFRMNATHVQCGWKPLWVFRNGHGDLPNWHKDLFTEGSREKSVAADGQEFAGGTWQQSEAEAAYWITELSKPDALVLDPFVGSGTTAAVCKSLGRRFVGCDVDEKAVESARERVRG